MNIRNRRTALPASGLSAQSLGARLRPERRGWPPAEKLLPRCARLNQTGGKAAIDVTYAVIGPNRYTLALAMPSWFAISVAPRAFIKEPDLSPGR